MVSSTKRLAEVEATIASARQRRIENARRNPSTFVELVGRWRERVRPDGRPVQPWQRLVQAPIHERIQDEITREPVIVFITFPEAGKSTQVALRVVHMLGNDSNLQIAYVSKTAKADSTCAKLARTTRQYIENPEVLEVFPHMHPGQRWADTSFTLQRSSYSGAPTVQIVGQYGDVEGERLDIIVVDDLYGKEISYSARQRSRLAGWVRGSLMDRLSANGRFIMFANAHHREDVAHQLERAGLPVVRIKVRDTSGNSVLPEVWPEPRLQVWYKIMGDVEARRAFECVPVEDAMVIFTKDALDVAFHPRCRPWLRANAEDRDGMRIVAALDPGHNPQANAANDTAISVVAIFPDEPETRQILHVRGGKWEPSFAADQILEVEERFGPDIFVLESVGAQRWMRTICEMRLEGLRAEARRAGTTCRLRMPNTLLYSTGARRSDPNVGLEGLAVEFRNGFWMIPDPDAMDEDEPYRDQFALLRTEFEDHVRGGHPPDRAMATWLAHEGGRFLLRTGARDEPEASDGDTYARERRAEAAELDPSGPPADF